MCVCVSGGGGGFCDMLAQQRYWLFCFGRLAIITLIFCWVRGPCIATIERLWGVSDTASITGSG